VPTLNRITRRRAAQVLAWSVRHLLHMRAAALAHSAALFCQTARR